MHHYDAVVPECQQNTNTSISLATTCCICGRIKTSSIHVVVSATTVKNLVLKNASVRDVPIHTVKPSLQPPATGLVIRSLSEIDAALIQNGTS